eukprot:4840949-Pleurochrysis_carterae.AAC.2
MADYTLSYRTLNMFVCMLSGRVTCDLLRAGREVRASLAVSGTKPSRICVLLVLTTIFFPERASATFFTSPLSWATSESPPAKNSKENFGRCRVCGDREEAIKAARKSGEAQRIVQKKYARLDHIMLERADKFTYHH